MSLAHPVLRETNICIQEGVIADYRDNPEMELPRLMYSYELKRVRYLLQAYHRIRLNKIEKFILHILEKEDVLQNLSEKEQTYAQVSPRPDLWIHMQALSAAAFTLCVLYNSANSKFGL